MATRSLGQLTLDLVAKIGGFTGPMDQAERKSRDFAKKSAGHFKTIGIAAGVAAAAVVASVVSMVNRQREAIDQQAKLAQTFNTSYASIGNLARAGDLAGISLEQITTASKQLDINLGKASQGIGRQAEILDKLKLSAQEVAKLPLDERIAAINKALDENVAKNERAAVAATLFGARNAAVLARLDADQIAEAARQMEIFGLNLSDIDAAKVEQANDALSTFSLLGQGIATQLTVALAPVLEAIGNQFLKAAEKSGGLKTAVGDFADDAVTALGKVLNVISLISRGFTALDQLLENYSADAVRNFALVGKAEVTGIDFLTGIDMSGQRSVLDGIAERAEKVRDKARANFEGLFDRPLAGTKLVEDARKASEDLAAETIRNRNEANKFGAAARGAFDSAASGAGRAAKSISPYEQALKALESQLDSIGVKSTSAVISTQFDIDQRKFGAITQPQETNLLSAAARVDDRQSIVDAAELTDKYAEQIRALEQLELARKDLSAISLADYEQSKKATELDQFRADLESGKIAGLRKADQERLENLAREIDLKEQAKELDESYLRLVEDLKTEEENRADQLRERIDLLKQISNLTDEDRKKQLDRAVDSAFPESDRPTAGVGLDQNNPAFGPLSAIVAIRDIDDQEEKQREKFAQQLALLEEFRQSHAELNETWNAKEQTLKAQHEQIMMRLELDRYGAVLTAVSGVLGNIASMQDKETKRGRAIARAAAIAQAITNAYLAFTGVLASAAAIPFIGWILAPIAAAAALASGLQAVTKIKGQAHGGLDRVPEDGTWLLQRGERVVTAQTSAKLDRTLEEVRMNGGRRSGRSVQINQTIQVTGTVDNRTATQLANNTFREQRIAENRFG